MLNKSHTKYKYIILILGALFLTLLRFFDEASIFSALLVLLGITCLLYGVRHSSNKKDYLLIGIIFILIYVIRFYDYTGSPFLDILLGIGIGLVMFMILSFERLFKRFEDKIYYIFIFPIINSLFMYFTEIVKINLPFRLDTYFSNIKILSQIVSLFGSYIINFLLALTASVIVFVIDHKKNKESKIIFIGFILLICFIIGYGMIHINKTNQFDNSKKDNVRIACATGPNNYAYSNSLDYPNLEESVSILKETVESAKKENAEIVLFCEEAFSIKDVEEEEFLNCTKLIAKENNIHILLAYETCDTNDDLNGKGENKLCFISNDGDILNEYTKHCIVPFIETGDYIKGDQRIQSFDITVHEKTVKIATAICYDTDYDTFMSTMDKDTELLLVPTWDWNVVRQLHLSVSQFRAISSGVTLVRSTYDGYNAVIDGTGKVLEKDSTIKEDYKNLFVYNVPIK